MYIFLKKTDNGLSPLSENDSNLINEIKKQFIYGITYSYIKIVDTGEIFNQDNYIKDIEFSELRFVPDVGIFGQCVAKKVEINFNNIDSKFFIQDKEFDLYIGVKYNNEEYYIKYGRFIVQHPNTETTTDNTSFTALDYMIKFNLKYKDTITYPCTLRRLAQNICEQLGLELSKESFRNENFIVENNQFVNGETYRQVLQGIAMSAFSWARIDENNILHFDLNKKEEPTETIDYEQYYNLNKDDLEYGPINRIVIRNSQIEGENVTVEDKKSIEINGITELVIADNPFAYTQEKRQELIEAGKELYGFKYMPVNDVSLIGFAFLNCTDKIRFKTIKNEYFDTYLFNHIIKYNGMLSDEIQSQAMTKTETKYTYTPDTSQRLKRTEIIVDKQNQTITSVAEQQKEQEQKITKQEQTIEGIKTNVSSIETKVETVEGTATKALEDASKAQSTANSATTKANNAQTSADNAQNTANTANTNAQNAQKTANSNTTAITTTNKKVAEIETSVKGISATVSSHAESIEQVQEQTNLNTDEIAKLGSTETIEGKELTVNASNNPAKLYCYGNTEQATRSGKNVLPNYRANTQTTNSLNFKNNDNGSFSLNGTASEYTQFIDTNTFKLKAGTYTLQSNNTNTSLTLQLRNEDGTTIITQTATHVTFTLSSDTIVKFRVVVGANGSFSNSTIFPLLYLGNYNSSMEYELYGVSPSPDYPSRIRNVGDNINLADIPDIQVSQSDTYHRVDLKPNKTYTISFIKSRINGVAISNNVIYKFATIRCFDSSGGVISNISSTTVTLPSGSIKLEQTFTTPADIGYVGINFGNNNSDSNVNTLVSNIKIEESPMSTPYTPYNCGSADFKVENENITDGILEQGTISDSNGTLIDSVYTYRSKNYCIVKSDTDYVFSINNVKNRIVIHTYDNKYNWLERIISENGNFKTSLQAKYIKYRGYNNDKDLLVTGKIQINEGSEVKPYIPHQEQIKSFPFTEGQVLHKGDYLAEDGIHQVRKTLVLTGTENWQDRPNFNECDRFVLGTDIIPKNSKGLCNYFKVTNSNTVNDIGYMIFNNGTQIIVNFSIKGTTNLNQFKTFLAEQYSNGTPVTIEYELAEEIVIPYTPEQQKVLDSIKTFKGINHIYCIDEIEPEKMILTYYPNTPYNDTLVNKDTFDKVTTDMNAEFNIRANEIETSVKEQTTASILTLLNNKYLNAEQVNALVGGNAEDIATVKEQLKQTVTSSQMQIEITKAIEGGVSYLKNTLFTIDENGMWIATSEDPFNALYNNTGMKLYSYEEMIARFDVDGATVQGNLNLNGEFITPNLRMMNVNVSGVPHTHIHWIGD